MKVHQDGHVDTFGQEMLNMAYRFLLVEANVQRITSPSTFFQVLKSFLEALSGTNPSAVHFDIAKQALPTLSESEMDLVARELLYSLQKLNKALPYPEFLKPHARTPYLTLIEPTEAEDRELFLPNGLSIWDQAYCNLIAAISKEGQKRAGLLEQQLATSSWSAEMWFKKPHTIGYEHFYLTEVFLDLATLLWNSLKKREAPFSKTTHLFRYDVSIHTTISA